MRHAIRQRQQAEVLLLVCHVRVVSYYPLEALRFVDLQGSGQNPGSEAFQFDRPKRFENSQHWTQYYKGTLYHIKSVVRD